MSMARVPQQMMSEQERHRTRNPLTGIREGISFLLQSRQVLRPALAKGVMTACLGALVYLLIIVAEDILMMRSEERRVGKVCSSRWWRYKCNTNSKNKTDNKKY